jgi:quercetin dioxygenase-like cupin family protein
MRTHYFLAALLARCANDQPAPSDAPAHPASTHVGVPGRCEDKAQGGGGAEGCYWNASVPLGRPRSQLYWHIDRFPDAASAEAARNPQSAVTTALGGNVFLQTVNEDAGWRPRGGERLSTVGPLAVSPDTEVMARFMEATTSQASATFPHTHSGPEGFFLLEGSICVETPSGAHRAGPGASLALPGGVPMQLNHAGKRARRSLVLVIHPSGKPWIDRKPQWAPTGACRA